MSCIVLATVVLCAIVLGGSGKDSALLHWAKFPSDEKQFGEFMRQAKNGDPEAQFAIGHCYEHGLYTKKDVGEAFTWYGESSKGKYRHGIFSLGQCLEHGIGCEKDVARAVKCYQEAIERGSVDAYVGYGLCLFNGRGVAVNQELGARYLQIAAEKDQPVAQWIVGELLYKGLVLNQDKKKARALLEKAASGYIPAAAEGARKILDDMRHDTVTRCPSGRIEGLSGIRFGQKFHPDQAPNIDSQWYFVNDKENENGYLIQPPRRFTSFSEYRVKVTPKSKLIYSIHAMAPYYNGPVRDLQTSLYQDTLGAIEVKYGKMRKEKKEAEWLLGPSYELIVTKSGEPVQRIRVYQNTYHPDSDYSRGGSSYLEMDFVDIGIEKLAKAEAKIDADRAMEDRKRTWKKDSDGL